MRASLRFFQRSLMVLSKPKALFFSCIIFLLFACVGLTQGAISNFWVDETVYLNNLKKTTWGEIFAGRSHIDQNHFPLYLSMERSYKTVLSSFGLEWPAPEGEKAQGMYENFDFQIYQRIPSVLFFSLTAAFSFYIFSLFFSPWVGLSSLLLMCGSEQVWAFIAQSRPYSLWYFLSAFQILYLLLIVFEKKKDDRALFILAGLNIVLSLLNGFVIYQVLVSILLVLIWGPKRAWFFLMSFLALGLWAFYIYQNLKLAGHFNFVFTPRGTPFNLIKANFPLERLLLLFGFIGFGVYQWHKSREIKPEMILAGICIFLLFGAAHMIHKFSQMTGFTDVFSMEVPNRYFIFLSPISVYATALLGWKIFQYLSPARRLQLIFVVGFVGMILLRMGITYKKFFYVA